MVYSSPYHFDIDNDYISNVAEYGVNGDNENDGDFWGFWEDGVVVVVEAGEV